MCQTRSAVPRHRSYRRRWLWLPALIGSATAQGAALVGYSVTRPEPLPTLTIELAGEGNGTVLITREGESAPMLRCSQPTCSVDVQPGVPLHMVAIADDGATFGGYYPDPIRPPRALQKLLGDPLARCAKRGSGSESANDQPAFVGDPSECELSVVANARIAVDFGIVPRELEVAMLEPATAPEINEPAVVPAPVKKVIKDNIATPVPEVALLPPPPPPKIDVIPPPPPPPADKKPPEPIPSNMTMVEVPDKNEVKEAPNDATHLSDKNRDVEQETNAKDTNLEKELDGKEVASKESDDTTSLEIGGPKTEIRQTEETEPTTDKRFTPSSDHSGDDKSAKGAIVGAGGNDGNEGTGETKTPGILSMRGLGGRGSLVAQKDGDGQKAGKKGLPGVNTQLAFNDYERIVGKDRVDEEAELARKKLAAKKGRYEKKLAAIKSSLENFTPDVRPGNQTALKTRAHPFAVYVARMHRRIHELWGFGFLQDLDDKASDNQLNDFELWTNLEVAINPDGSIYKVTIAHPSGHLEFDVAAIDAVQSSGPFEATPETIRSVDGRVYLRWGFHRDWRQCGTFNVEPYILSDIPGGSVPIDDGEKVKSVPKLGKTKVIIDASAKPVTPDAKDDQGKNRKTSIKDDKALFAANVWVSGFATAQMDKLLEYSTLPFVVSAEVTAKTKAELKDAFTELIVDSGSMRNFDLYTGAEYSQKVGGGVKLADDRLVLVVNASKHSFAVVLAKNAAGEYRATQLSK
jgi:TonB family protein